MTCNSVADFEAQKRHLIICILTLEKGGGDLRPMGADALERGDGTFKVETR